MQNMRFRKKLARYFISEINRSVLLLIGDGLIVEIEHFPARFIRSAFLARTHVRKVIDTVHFYR